MKRKIIGICCILVFVVSQVSFVYSMANPPKDHKIPGMLLDESPYYSYINLENETTPSFEYTPPPISGSVGDWIEQIDADIVLNYIQGLVDFGPRVTESTACDNAGTYIYDQFNAMGLDTRYQYWDSGSLSGKNVEATLPGEDPTSDKIFVVLGHYDSVSGSPGADDNAAGATSALAAAEILSECRFRHTIRFLTVDGEEQGLVGSSEYCEEASNNGDNIIAALNADMIGFAPNPGDGDIVKLYINTASSEWLYPYIENITVYYDTEIGGLELIDAGSSGGSDHASFNAYGYDACFYHEYNFNDYYHSPNDVIAHMNMSYDAKVTRLIVATLAELAEPIVHDHDIIVKDLVVPSVVPHGETQIVSGVIRNGGNTSESDVIVNFLINDTIVDSMTIPFLAKMASTMVNFSWDPALGSYIVAIDVPPIANEGDTTNNNKSTTVSVISSPVIEVSPSTLFFMLPTESTDHNEFTITNTVTAEAALQYNLSYDGDFDGSWITASPSSGTISIGNSQNVTVTVDSTGLAEGTYAGYVLITSNDVNDPELTISITMTVVYGNDMKAVSLNYPTGVIASGPYTVNATVQNIGYYPQTGVVVNCSIFEGGIGGVILDEDFSTNPSDWTITHVDGTAWTWDSSDKRMENTYGFPNTGYLDSPVLDCSGKTGISLSFWHYWWASYSGATQDGYVRGSIDGGVTFPYLIDEFHHNDPGEETAVKEYDISSWADGQSNVVIRFDVYNYNDWYWYIDDVNVSAEITGPLVYYAETTIDIAQYASQYVEFTPPWNTGMGMFGVQIATKLAGDENPGNDVIAEVVSVQGPGLSYSPHSYNFGTMLVDTVDTTSVDVWNSGVGILTYTLDESASWVTLSSYSGTSSGEHDAITVIVNTTGLTTGSYHCDVDITSDGGSGVFGIDIIVVDSMTPMLDVEQTIYDRGFPIRHAIDGDWGAAQSFTPTMSAISGAEVYLRKFGTPEFDLTVELRENHPQGLLIDTLVFTPAEVGEAFSWIWLDFEDTPVTPDTTYFVVIPPAPSGVTTSFGYEWGYAFGDQYGGGAFWFTRNSGALWRDLPTMYEYTFKTYGLA